MLGFVYTSIYGNAEVFEQWILIQFFLNLWPQLHSESVGPPPFSEDLMT